MFQVRDYVSRQNLLCIQQLGGSEILLDVCCNLVMLRRYDLNYRCSSGSGLSKAGDELLEQLSSEELALPVSLSEAISVRSSLAQVRNEVTIISKLVAVQHLLEPLTPERLQKVGKISDLLRILLYFNQWG